MKKGRRANNIRKQVGLISPFSTFEKPFAGIIKGTFTMVINMFKNVFKKRNNNEHIWLLLLSFIIFLITFVNSGYSVIGLMYYKLHYNMTTEVYGNLILVWMLSMFCGQMFLVPFLSQRLGWKDTSILLIGLLPAAFSMLGEAASDKVWVVFLLAAVFYMLYYNIVTTSKSAMSKVVGPTEVGKAFGLLGIFEASLAILAKISYGVMYKATVGHCPEFYMYISSSCCFLALIFAFMVHMGLKKSDAEVDTIHEKTPTCS